MINKKVYDGTDVILGRLGSQVARDLLKGYDVDIINCDRIIVSGSKKIVADNIAAKIRMGSGSSLKGPKYPRTTDRLVKRMIRGMLPWDRTKGREAYKKLRCYMSTVLIDGDIEVIKLNHRKPMKHFCIADIAGLLKQ
jgi:large subunit ribosomal protein L13